MGKYDENKRQQRAVIRAECKARNIKIEQRERCYLLQGPGVDLLAADLAALDVLDLRPHNPRSRVARD